MVNICVDSNTYYDMLVYTSTNGPKCDVITDADFFGDIMPKTYTLDGIAFPAQGTYQDLRGYAEKVEYFFESPGTNVGYVAEICSKLRCCAFNSATLTCAPVPDCSLPPQRFYPVVLVVLLSFAIKEALKMVAVFYLACKLGWCCHKDVEKERMDKYTLLGRFCASSIVAPLLVPVLGVSAFKKTLLGAQTSKDLILKFFFEVSRCNV